MRKTNIIEDGKVIFCDEADFIYMDDLIAGAAEVLGPYATPVALQYLKMARQLIHCRRLEIFDKKAADTCQQQNCCLEETSRIHAPEIEFRDSRRK